MKYLCLVYLEGEKLHAVPDRECLACGEGFRERGLLLASGPLSPRTGGALLQREPDEGARATLDRIRDDDPYTKTGMAQYELLPWVPNLGAEGLERL